MQAKSEQVCLHRRPHAHPDLPYDSGSKASSGSDGEHIPFPRKLNLSNSFFERYWKNIPPFPDNFESKFNIFKMQLAGKYSLKEYLPMILQIRDIITNHKQSPVEFARKNVFVICSDDFRLQTITIDQIKEFIKKTKEFNTAMNGIVKNERVFG